MNRRIFAFVILIPLMFSGMSKAENPFSQTPKQNEEQSEDGIWETCRKMTPVIVACAVVAAVAVYRLRNGNQESASPAEAKPTIPADVAATPCGNRPGACCCSKDPIEL